MLIGNDVRKMWYWMGLKPLSVKKGDIYDKEIRFSYTGYHNHYHRNLVDMGEFIAKKKILRRTVQKKNRDLKIGDKLC